MDVWHSLSRALDRFVRAVIAGPELPLPRLGSGPEQAKMYAYLLLKEAAGAWCPALRLFTISVVSLLITSQEGSCLAVVTGQVWSELAEFPSGSLSSWSHTLH